MEISSHFQSFTNEFKYLVGLKYVCDKKKESSSHDTKIQVNYLYFVPLCVCVCVCVCVWERERERERERESYNATSSGVRHARQGQVGSHERAFGIPQVSHATFRELFIKRSSV
jgi:hypothetical protein